MTAKIHNSEDIVRGGQESPRDYFLAATTAHNTGQFDKATRYLRMVINSHNTDLLNQYDLKSLGESKNA